MSHVIKMHCSENHQMPAFRRVDSGLVLPEQVLVGEVPGGAAGGASQGAHSGASPARSPWCGLIRLSCSNSLSTFHRISPNEILPLKRKQALVDFLGKRPLQNLIYHFFVSIYFISGPQNMGKHVW